MGIFKKKEKIYKEEKRKQPKKVTDYVDHLDEDPPITGQNYFILSYFITGDPEAPVMFKCRGVFNSLSDCESRITELRKIDTTFHMFTVSVGKWGSLYSADRLGEITALENIDMSYNYSNVEKNTLSAAEVSMNDIMSVYKEKMNESKKDFNQRIKQGDTDNLKVLSEDILNLKARIKMDMTQLKELQGKLQLQKSDIKQLLPKEISEVPEISEVVEVPHEPEISQK